MKKCASLSSPKEPQSPEGLAVAKKVREIFLRWNGNSGTTLNESLWKNIQQPYYYENGRWDTTALQKNYSRREAQITLGLPVKINVEVTTQCTCRCDFCVLHSGALRQRRSTPFMTIPTFEAFLSQAKDITSHIEFTGGEPLLNRKLFSMIRRCNQERIKTTVATNAQLLDFDKREQLLTDPPSILLVAYESGNPDAYKSLRKGGSYHRMVSNVESLISQRNLRNQASPIVWLQTVVSRKTLPYLDAFWRDAKSMGVDIAGIKPILVWPDGGKEHFDLMIEKYLIPNHRLSYYRTASDGSLERTGVENYCPNLQQMQIGTGGEVIPCWYNLLSSPVMGNITKSHLIDIWLSEKYQAFRKQMQAHTAYEHKCKYCIGIYVPKLFETRNCINSENQIIFDNK